MITKEQEEIRELSGRLNRGLLTIEEFNNASHKINVRLWKRKGVNHVCGDHCFQELRDDR